jgi:hypothetical protein
MPPRGLITRYRTCHSAAEVQAMQDEIMGEIDAETDERRKIKGLSLVLSADNLSLLCVKTF